MTDLTALADKIKALESLSADERVHLLRLLQNPKKYGLIWEDKPEKVETQLAAELPVLEQIEQNALLNGLQTKNGDSLFPEKLPPPPTHLLIEGDNLHALTALSFTHRERVDVIYIDPPYNTGNRDFKYNDRYIDREDAWRHSTWLSFMHKRLVLARDLLKDSGVIFISIDDNEQAQLRLLMDEIFGEANWICQFIWKSRKMVDNRTKTGVSNDHEYILCYRKTELARLRGSEKDLSKFSNPDEDTRGPWRSADLTGLANVEQRPNLHYELTDPTTGIVYECPQKGWRFDKKTMAKKIAEGRVLFPANESGRPRQKLFQLEMTSEFIGFGSLITSTSTEEGTKELKGLFENPSFSFPKPTRLIQDLIQQFDDPNALILDFFAGSGTTAHAVMSLNAEDGGTRRCILVTNNELNGAEAKLREKGLSEEEIQEHGICRSVTLPRLRKVIDGYTRPNGEAVAGLKNNRLRYFRTAFAPAEPTLENKIALTRKATDLLCIRHDCFDEAATGIEDVRLFARFDAQRLMVIYSEDAISEAVEFIAAAADGLRFQVYVFSIGHDPYQEEFLEVLDRVELLPIPQAIYNVYQHVYRRMSKK